MTKPNFSKEEAVARAASLMGGGEDPIVPPTPPETPPAPPAPTNTQNSVKPEDAFAFFKEKFGLSTEAEVSEMLDRSKKFAELEQSSTKINEELEALRAKASMNPFASPYVEKLNGLYAANASQDQINAFMKISTLGDVKKLDDLEVRKLALQLRDGYTEREAEILINTNYKLNEDDYLEEEVILSKANLRKDVQADREFIESHVEELSQTAQEKSQKAEQAKIAQYTTKIDQIIPLVLEQSKVIPKVPLGTKEGDFEFDFPISEALLKEAPAMLRDFAIQNKIPLNAEGVEELKEHLHTIAIATNYKEYLKTAFNEGAKSKEKEMLAYYNFPGQLPNGTQRTEMTRPDNYEDWKKQKLNAGRR